jgi:DNA-binding transcriptional ArsR family regulator
MLYTLLDGRARTGTELAVVAAVSPSTASVHLQRLQTQQLVRAIAQGKHRYYSLRSPDVAAALEALSVLAGGSRGTVASRVPSRLLLARTCYDHLAGAAGVTLHDRFLERGWLSAGPADGAYDLTRAGAATCESLGIDADAIRGLRRRFAFACLDWSERRPHLGGALAAALLGVCLDRKWMVRDPDSRALRATPSGRRELLARFGVDVPIG